MVEAIKKQKIIDEKEKKKTEITIKAELDIAKITAESYKNDEKKSPFVPKW